MPSLFRGLTHTVETLPSKALRVSFGSDNLSWLALVFKPGHSSICGLIPLLAAGRLIWNRHFEPIHIKQRRQTIFSESASVGLFQRFH